MSLLVAASPGLVVGDGSAADPSQTRGSQQRTMWDGVFSKEQTARGVQYYRRSCGHCHADDLSGGGDGEPPLAGTIFLAHWHQRSAAELFSFISETMPYSAPGRLSGQEYVDVLSYILEVNGAPAGTGELSADLGELKAILLIDPAAIARP